MDIVFIVLHYMVIEETKKCIEYIERNIDTPDYHVVLVDNASPNGSGKILQEYFVEDTYVTVILNKSNLGFAKGNNIGFRYAKKQWEPRYIVFLNNDVFLYEKELIKKLDEEYNKSAFYVLGPLVMTGDGKCNINPDNAIFKNVNDIEKTIRRFEKLYFRYKYHYAKLFFWFNNIIAVFLGGGNPKKENKNYLDRQENVKLHGCFLVFSKEYILEYNGLDESTYLYWEEEFLYKHMISQNKKTVYNPNIVVFHKEDAATDSLEGGDRKKKMFLYKNYIDSLKKLRELYIHYDEEK